MSEDARAELAAAIAILRAHHMNRATLDWAAVEADAFAMAAHADTAAEAYPAIRYVIRRLGEHHTFLLSAAEAGAVRADRPEGSRAVVGDAALPSGREYAGRVAALTLPGHVGAAKSNRDYVLAVRAFLAAAAARGDCRILVDLRRNRGGNVWPMLNGVASLLGPPPFGYFLEADGTQTAWDTSKGWMAMAADGVPAAPRDLVDAQSALPVVVLVGGSTGSAGEFTAMAFEGRPNTRIIGEKTAGYVSVNKPYTLPDGAEIAVSIGWAADRLHRMHQAALVPDELTAPGAATWQAAMAWLKAQPCGPSRVTADRLARDGVSVPPAPSSSVLRPRA